MANSRISQTSISGESNPQVVEIVRVAITRATAILDSVAPDHDLDAGDVRVGVALDPSDPDAAEALARLIAIKALESIGEQERLTPEIRDWSGKGIQAGVAPTTAVTPQAILLDPSFSGGVRGKLADKSENPSYRRNSRGATLAKIEKKVKSTILDRTNLFGAKVTHEHTGDDHLQLKVVVADDALVVRVYSETDTLPRGPHAPDGELTGPARFFPTLNQHGRLVGGRVGIDEDLHTSDIARALGHQVDLIAGILHGGHLTAEALRREMRAEQTQGERDAEQPVTVQDRATLAELQELWTKTSVSGLSKRPSPTEIGVEKAKLIEAKLKAWGLIGQHAKMASRIELLVEQLEAQDRQLLSQLLAGLHLQGLPDAQLEIKDFGHVMLPKDNGNRRSWVDGGHQQDKLLPFVAAHSAYSLVEVGRHDAGGQPLRRYAQLRWKDETRPKPGPDSPDHPVAGTTPGTVDFQGHAADWEQSDHDKTTFEDLFGFLREAEKAWKNFLAKLGTPSTGVPASNGGEWHAWSGPGGVGGVPVMGYAFKRKGKPGYDFSSVFPDAQELT